MRDMAAPGPQRYSRDFFALQLDFARRVSSIGGLSLADAVFTHTNFYIRFGFGRDFDAAHLGWREYLGGLREAGDQAEWTYRFYMVRPPEVGSPPVVATCGCFAYARLDASRIRLHFHDAEAGGVSPLSIERRGQRLGELADLFAHAKRTAGGSARVVGASWLYNLEAYRRLFPPSYLATARVLPGRYRHMPLWGQFVDRRGEVREKPTAELRARLASQSSLLGLDECFPLQVLGLEAPVTEFCDFLGV
jgi:hypothetical protein